MNTAFKTKRWFADTYQKWMDIEAKLIGKGKIRQVKTDVKITNVKPTLATRVSRWKPHQVLMNNLAWEEWTYEWEGEIRPFTKDQNIWSDINARMLSLILPITPLHTNESKLKCPWTGIPAKGRLMIVDVVLDEGPETFILADGQTFNLAQLTQLVLDGYRIGFRINAYTEAFFARCRRQYFPMLGQMSSMDYFNWYAQRSIPTGTPNATSKEWKAVLEARKQRAFSAFLGRKLI